MSPLPAALPATVASRLLRAADLPRRGASLRPGDRLPTGIAPFDALLGGGLPCGALVELSGRAGGRFALVLAALAAATSRGEAAALLDLGDHLDPSCAEEAGCDLARLLWVRPLRFRDALLAAETVAAAGFRLVVLDAGLSLPSSRLRDAGPWLRLARAAAPRGVAFLLSTPVPLAGLAAEALVGVSARALFQQAGSVRFLAGAAASLSLLKVRGGRPAEAPLLALSPLAAPLARRLLPALHPAAPALPTPTRAATTPAFSVAATSFVPRAPSRTAHEPPMAPPRLLALAVPLFPLAARLRAEPPLRDEALAVTEGNGSAARVVAATRTARAAGVKPGMTLPQARALVPRLLARGRDPHAEKAAQEALLDAAGRFSPRVEDAGDGLAFLDLAGLAPRSASTPEAILAFERDLALDLLRAAEKDGLPARAGVASSKRAARIAASLPRTPVVVPPGEEARFLSPLPVERLAPELSLSVALSRWGVRTAGDLARLPAAEVGTRLGDPGRRLHEAARGLDPEPFVPRLPALAFTEGASLDWPVVALEPFLAFAGAALERLVRRLAAEALGCARLELSLHLEPEGCDVRSLDLPGPTRDVKTLLSLLRQSLDARPAGAPVTGFVLAACPDRPRRGQLTLFGPPEISPDELAGTLAHLLALLGEGRAGSPRSADGHVPGRFALVPYAPPPAPLLTPPLRPARGLLAVRALRPAVELEVLTHADTPVSLNALPPSPTPVRGRVRVAAGPWSLEDGWWSETPAARDYWDVELDGGGLYRVYRDRPTGRWYADGVYD